jgi:hypothetical protein
MRFEVSERLRTGRSHEEVMGALEAQFRKIAGKTVRGTEMMTVGSIEPTFGSINRSDTTIVSVRSAEGGWLIVADVSYRPSVAFWVIVLLTIFTWIFWLIPIVFYLTQKATVRNAIVECLDRIKKEFDGTAPRAEPTRGTSISDIEKLGSLKEKGLITDDEFRAKKKQLLGL